MKANKPQTVWTALGALATAVLASACCLGPVVLAALGAGSLGFASALAPYRPYFLGLTILLLAVAFYVTYRPPRAGACSAEGGTCAVPSARRNKVILWMVTALVLVAAAFPRLQTLRNRPAQAANAAAFAAASTAAHQLTFQVEGMTCTDCAVQIQKKLAQVPGVTNAAVSFERKQAVVEWNEEKPTETALAQAVKEAGYQAVLPAPGKE